MGSRENMIGHWLIPGQKIEQETLTYQTPIFQCAFYSCYVSGIDRFGQNFTQTSLTNNLLPIEDSEILKYQEKT